MASLPFPKHNWIKLEDAGHHTAHPNKTPFYPTNTLKQRFGFCRSLNDLMHLPRNNMTNFQTSFSNITFSFSNELFYQTQIYKQDKSRLLSMKKIKGSESRNSTFPSSKYLRLLRTQCKTNMILSY